MTTCRWSAGCMCWPVPGGRLCPPYIGRQTRSVDRSPGQLQQGNLSIVCLHHGRLIQAALIRLECLSCTPSLEVVMDWVVWRIFWKVFKRSCRPPTRSVGSTNRSAGLLVGRTHLSGTAVSLIGGDPGVPMSHTTRHKGPGIGLSTSLCLPCKPPHFLLPLRLHLVTPVLAGIRAQSTPTVESHPRRGGKTVLTKERIWEVVDGNKPPPNPTNTRVLQKTSVEAGNGHRNDSHVFLYYYGFAHVASAPLTFQL
jgi:hypothetical protein